METPSGLKGEHALKTSSRILPGSHRMFNASIAPRLVAVGALHDQTSRVLVSEGGEPPPCGTVVAPLRARATSSVACRTHTPAGYRHKNSARNPGRYQPGG